jgi:hypothetical protein
VALVESPLEIVLEFARAEATGDAHAFRFAPQSYVVRTPRGGFGASELAWNEELLAKLAAVRLSGQNPALLAELGALMRRFLAPAGWELHEQQLTAAMQQRRSVHITIRSAAAELYALPWELLTLRATGQSLGGLPGVLVRYAWPETETAAGSDIPPSAGRILVAWSAAGGGVPANEHLAAIRAAATAGGLAFEADDVLAHASPGRIAAALVAGERSGRPVTALHLLCHGGARDSFFGLVLDGETDADARVLLDPARLQQILAPHAATLRLVVLAACDGGNAGKLGGLIGSTAQLLHRAGLAAVVASRYPLSVSGSETLTATLFHGLLAERSSLEEAFVAARTALGSDVERLDWASVQLYARASDGAATYPVVPRKAVAPEPVVVPVTTTPVTSRLPRMIGALVGVLALAFVGAWAGGVLGGIGPAPASPPGTRPEPADGSNPPDQPAIEPVSKAMVREGEAPEEAPKDVAVPAAPVASPVEVTREPAAPRTGKTSNPTPLRPSVECRSAVKSYVQALLPASSGRVVKLVVKADAKGALSVTGSDETAVAAARARLKSGRADKVKQQAGEDLPCHYSYEWMRPDEG